MAEAVEKIKLLKSAPDLSTATYQIHDESHTIGNALRWMLMKNPKVEFCGYRMGMRAIHPGSEGCILLHQFVPHPSENVINVRIQMYDNLSSLDALITALGELDKVCESVEDDYLTSLREGDFERWEERT